MPGLMTEMVTAPGRGIGLRPVLRPPDGWLGADRIAALLADGDADGPGWLSGCRRLICAVMGIAPRRDGLSLSWAVAFRVS
jgi:hypothetical protein